MYPKKSLSIMQSSYEPKMKQQQQQQQQQQDSLMSPPLTPTDIQYPLSAIMDQPVMNRRKEFIHSYSKMVPYLRPDSNYYDNDKIIELNVYKDYYKKQQQKKDHNSLKNCTRSDNVVSHSKKRKLAFIHTQDNMPVVEATHNKRKRVSSFLPTGKDAALAFDTIDIDTPNQDFYPLGWEPLAQALDIIPVKVSWKGAPLPIDKQPYFEQLHPVEASMASILRLSPVQYLRCKRTLILASRTLKIQDIPFTKSVAQKLCRVDVNKTSALWTAFGQLGWFNGPV